MSTTLTHLLLRLLKNCAFKIGHYIADHLAYQNRNDLNLYKTNNLESTFFEITNPNKSNIIVGCIYRHPKMDLFEFIHYYLNPLLEKLAKEQKTVFLLGDFNVDLLKYE